MKSFCFLLYLFLFTAVALLAIFPFMEQAPTKVVFLLTSPPPQHLPMPVDGKTRSSLADSWGAARPGNRRHQGIDIFAKRNTPVRSTTRGMVLKKGTNRLGGLVVKVLGPGGQVHYYAHLERYGEYDRFDWVEPGDVIGYVGNSGNARGTSPHLHYGIYTQSNGAINPYPLLAGPGPDNRSRASSSAPTQPTRRGAAHPGKT